jgi:hypothetical protein
MESMFRRGTTTGRQMRVRTRVHFVDVSRLMCARLHIDGSRGYAFDGKPFVFAMASRRKRRARV